MRGYVSAYDAETGKLDWRFYTVPGDPAKAFEANKALEMAATTWNGDWWKYGGGGTVWDAIVYDPELEPPLRRHGQRLALGRNIRSPGGGDNLFLSSIVAINAGHRRIRVALPDHAGRDVGLHRDAADDARGPRDRRPSCAR